MDNFIIVGDTYFNKNFIKSIKFNDKECTIKIANTQIARNDYHANNVSGYDEIYIYKSESKEYKNIMMQLEKN